MTAIVTGFLDPVFTGLPILRAGPVGAMGVSGVLHAAANAATHRPNSSVVVGRDNDWVLGNGNEAGEDRNWALHRNGPATVRPE